MKIDIFDVDSAARLVFKSLQVVDEDWEQIKYGYLKMIMSAKHSIYIQSPYFILINLLLMP